jgi:hypothetical protein
VFGTGVIKVNDFFISNDVAFMDRLRYNMLSVSQLVDADLSVMFHKFNSRVLDSSGGLVVVFLGLEIFFKLISHLLNLP